MNRSYKIKPHSIREVFLCVFVLVMFRSFSQNKSTNTFTAKGISDISIDGEQIFNIKVETAPVSEITVTSITDGEYQNNFKVISEVKGNELVLQLKQNILEDIPDDKRNAHKVIAASVELLIPEQLNVSIKSDVGSVVADGAFEVLNINLAQGGCNIDAIAKLATIKTTNGNIYVETRDAIISTDSKSGLVDFPSDMMGINLWKLSTTSGNITVKKQE